MINRTLSPTPAALLSVVSLCLGLSGCAVISPRQQAVSAPIQPPLQQLPLHFNAKDKSQWEKMLLPGKLRTAYRLERQPQGYALQAQADIGEVVLVARNGLKAAGLLAHFGLKGKVIGFDAHLPEAALLVNASPLGMVGQEKLEIDLSPLPEHAIVYDLVYAPIETPLLKAARKRDLETVDGLEMLVGQAAIAFELFFGVAPPEDNEDALRALLLK
jgi:hypothetical protein